MENKRLQLASHWAEQIKQAHAHSLTQEYITENQDKIKQKAEIKEPAEPTNNQFVELHFTPNPEQKQQESIEVILRNKYKLILNPGFHAETFTRVVKLLEHKL